MNNIKELETLCNNKFKVALEFCQELFPDGEVSLRLLAESEELKNKLAARGASGKRLDVIKLQPEQGPLEKRLESAAEFNSKGYGVFYLPQRFKAGVYDEDFDAVEAIRAVVIDLDGPPLKPVQDFSVPPTVIVETSPGRYQCVWRFEETKVGSFSVDAFGTFAADLGALFGGDLSTAKATQPFRLPGFYHVKREPYESRIISTSNSKSTSLHELIRAIRSKYDSAEKGHNGKGSDEIANGDSGESASELDLESVQRGKIKVRAGQRHHTLLRLCVSLFHKGLKKEEVEKEAERVVCASFEDGAAFLGRRADEFSQCISDGQKYYEKNREKDLQAMLLELSKSEKLKSGFVYDFNVGVLKVNRYSQSAVAERVLQRFEKDFARIDDRIWCFNGAEKLWCVQDSLYPETKARVLACIRDMIGEEGFQRTCCADSKGRVTAEKKHHVELELFKINSVHSISRSVLNHVALPKYKFGDFDSAESLLFCANGVLNLETGELRDARNEDRLICRTDIEWKAGAKCTGWIKFLGEVFEENEDAQAMINFMQELFAYCLSGRINEQKIFCFQGDGANGKSKTLDALKLICGGYATILEPEELVTKIHGFQKAFERVGAKVEGRRVVVIDDFEVESAWNESFVKTLTSPEIRCRGEYEHSRVSPNRAKFFIGLNKAPKPEAENLGILRRLCFIPFCRTFKASAVKSSEIDRMIRAEACGILGWAVEAFNKVKERGLKFPVETEAALDSYRRETFKLDAIVEANFEFPKTELEGSWFTLEQIWQGCVNVFEGQTLTQNFPEFEPKSLARVLNCLGAKHRRARKQNGENAVSQFLVSKKARKNIGTPIDTDIDTELTL